MTIMANQAAFQGENLRKGPWLKEEDERLETFVKLLGEKKWDSIAKASGIKRSGKSCRMRWLNYLRPNIKRGHISAEEETIIIQLHQRWGNKWSRIARRLPGRTDNEIKNYWRSHLTKKLQAKEEGIIAKQDFRHRKDNASAWNCENEDKSSLEDGVQAADSCSLDRHELSKLTYLNSPYEIRLHSWMTELSEDEGKTGNHRDCNSSGSCLCCLAWNFEDRDTNIFDPLGSLWEMN